MIIKGNLFSEMLLISNYFQAHAEKDASFLPEFQASHKINNYIKEWTDLTKDNVPLLLNIVNEVEKTEHYNGSGWMDYKMHLNGFLLQNGFTIDWKLNTMTLL